MARNPRQSRSQNVREPKEFEEVVLQIARVTRVVKGGRRLRFRALVAIGNRKGKVGLGTGKAGEVSDAIKKAVNQAKKDMLDLPIVQETVPHEVRLKFKAAEILILPAPSGKGIIAGGAMRVILDLAGYKSVYGKRFGTTNLYTNAQAVMKALRKLHLVEGQEKDKLESIGTTGVMTKRKGKVERPAHTFGRKAKEEAKPAPVEEAPVAEEAISEAPTETTEVPVEAAEVSETPTEKTENN